jgi:hypothetical protein
MANFTAIGNGLDFNKALHEGLMRDRGTDMIHEIAILCTCRNGDPFSTLEKPSSTNKYLSCSKCGNEFWLYRDPVVVTGFTTSIRQNLNISPDAMLMPGDMMFGTGYPSNDYSGRTPRIIGMFDKLTATWPQPVDGGQVIVRGAGSKGKGAEFTTLAENEDKLWYEPHSAIWCEDQNGVVYKEGDFRLGPGRVITWEGNAPAIGTKYTIKYSAFFEWIVFQPPQERIDRGGQDIGQSISLKKKHVVFPNDNPSTNKETKLSLQERFR